MQPDQPQRPDYNFILNPQSPPKRSALNASSLKQRLIIVAGGAALLLVLAIVVSSLLFGGNDNSQRLISLVSQQRELVRVSEQGEKNAQSTETRNFASTVSLSMSSAQTEMAAYLDKAGLEVDTDKLIAGNSAQTDEALTRAGQINQYDQKFNELIKAALTKYQQSLQAAFDASGSRSEKELLQKLFQNAQTLTATVPGS